MPYKYPLRFKLKASPYNAPSCVGTVVEFTDLNSGTVVVGSRHYREGHTSNSWSPHTNTECWEPVVTESLDNQAVLEVKVNEAKQALSTFTVPSGLHNKPVLVHVQVDVSAIPSLLTRSVRWSVLAITSIVYSVKSLFKGGK